MYYMISIKIIKKTTYYFLLGIVIFLMLFSLHVLAPPKVNAQEDSDLETINLLKDEFSTNEISSGDSTQTSLGVSPAILELILTPGEQTETEIVVFNNATIPLPLKGKVESFVVNEAFIEKSDDLRTERYDASSWFSIEPADFIIQPGQSVTVKVTASPPKYATPGGHYATVFFQPLIPEEFLSQSSAHLTARLGVLLLSIVKGDIVEKASIGELSDPGFNRTGPLTFTVPIANDGNMHVLPSGRLLIKNSKNETIEEIPMKPSTVLPSTLKEFEFIWDKNYIFGTYTAIAEVTYGPGEIELISKPVTFTVFPWIRVTFLTILLTGSLILYKLIGKNVKKAFKVLFE